jgi:hypothetical protein
MVIYSPSVLAVMPRDNPYSVSRADVASCSVRLHNMTATRQLLFAIDRGHEPLLQDIAKSLNSIDFKASWLRRLRI